MPTPHSGIAPVRGVSKDPDEGNGIVIEPGSGGGPLKPESFLMLLRLSVDLISVELVANVRWFGCDVPYEGIVDFFSTVTLTAVEVGVLERIGNTGCVSSRTHEYGRFHRVVAQDALPHSPQILRSGRLLPSWLGSLE